MPPTLLPQVVSFRIHCLELLKITYPTMTTSQLWRQWWENPGLMGNSLHRPLSRAVYPIKGPPLHQPQVASWATLRTWGGHIPACLMDHRLSGLSPHQSIPLDETGLVVGVMQEPVKVYLATAAVILLVWLVRRLEGRQTCHGASFWRISATIVAPTSSWLISQITLWNSLRTNTAQGLFSRNWSEPHQTRSNWCSQRSCLLLGTSWQMCLGITWSRSFLSMGQTNRSQHWLTASGGMFFHWLSRCMGVEWYREPWSASQRICRCVCVCVCVCTCVCVCV